MAQLMEFIYPIKRMHLYNPILRYEWELWGLVVVNSIPTWGKSSKHHWGRPYWVLTEKWSDQAILLQSQTAFVIRNPSLVHRCWYHLQTIYYQPHIKHPQKHLHLLQHLQKNGQPNLGATYSDEYLHWCQLGFTWWTYLFLCLTGCGHMLTFWPARLQFEDGVYFAKPGDGWLRSEWVRWCWLLDTISSTCSLSVKLSATGTTPTAQTVLELAWWLSSEIIHTCMHAMFASHSYYSRVAFSSF